MKMNRMISSISENQNGGSSELDAASRRRLQNRLNQRASRQRQALQRQSHAARQGRRWVYYTQDADAFAKNTETSKVTTTPSQRYRESTLNQTNSLVNFNSVDSATREKLWAELETRIASGVPFPEPLLPVTQFNIIRAMFVNAASMGLTKALLGEDIASDFNIPGPMTLHLPPTLHPSSLQRRIIHHPWIDLIPICSVRNTLLSNLGNYDEEEFCGDLYGVCSAANEVGLIVWGEAWDPNAYEVSEQVLRKWDWIWRDCPDLLVTTNYWRRIRGERPLKLPKLGERRVVEIHD